MRFLPLVWSNLRRRKLRSALTLLSILVAFVLYGYLCAIEQALAGGVSVAGADRLVVRHRISIIQLLPEAYKSRIAQVPGVAHVMHLTWFGGTYKHPKNFFARIPVVPEDLFAVYPDYVLTEDARRAWLQTRTGAIAGRSLAERFGWKVGDRIPIQADIWTRKGGNRTWEFDLAGIYDGAKEGTDTTQFFFRHDYFDEARAMGSGLVGWYVLKVADPARAAEIAAKIDAEFENSPNETKAEPEGAFVQAFAKQLGDIATILIAILGAVFFTILLVAGNTMGQAVRERIEELGVLKALGFGHGQVLLLVLAESCLLSVAGGWIGLLLAWQATSAGDPTGGYLQRFFLPVDRVILGLGLAVILGVVAGVLPALQARRLRIADALRRM
jgi:putative ABC transport system permease protein